MENNEKRTLTAEEKLEIIIKSKDMSLREIAKEYQLHHSTVAEIVDESKRILQEHWQEKSKRIGRPKKVKTTAEKKVEELEAEIKARDKDLALKSMRIDWLNLQLSWAKEREQEFNIPARKQFKKKKK